MSTLPDPDLAERVAVFRHGIVSRLLPADLSAEDRRREVRRIIDAEHQIPGTTRTRIAEGTLRDWMRLYRAGGFEALRPKVRSDAGSPRALDPALAERLLELKEAEPSRTIRECIRLVVEERGATANAESTSHAPASSSTSMSAPTHSTVHRLFVRHGLNRRNHARDGAGVDRRRFAYREPGQLWMSDVMHGPAVPTDTDRRRRRKSYLIGFLDDATRLVPFATFTRSESTAHFLPVFKQALMRRGIPERLYVDNGANYRSHHLRLVCAKLGIALIHAKPRSPQGKGKAWAAP